MTAEASCRHSSGLAEGPATRSGPNGVPLVAARALAVRRHSCGPSVSPWGHARGRGVSSQGCNLRAAGAQPDAVAAGEPSEIGQ